MGEVSRRIRVSRQVSGRDMIALRPHVGGMRIAALWGGLLLAVAPIHGEEAVVLLHGLGRGPASMWPLEHSLRREGYPSSEGASPSSGVEPRSSGFESLSSEAEYPSSGREARSLTVESPILTAQPLSLRREDKSSRFTWSVAKKCRALLACRWPAESGGHRDTRCGR